MGRKTVIQSVSFQPEVWNYLQTQQNISWIVNQAIKEYRHKNTTPELKIRMLREKKREKIKEINLIDEQIKDLK